MATFKDFNFKLLVIEKLMYEDRTLTPAFDLGNHLRAQGIADGAYDYTVANGWEYTIIAEARAYFEELTIPDELLASVNELTCDGGLEVYQECAPVWDGEDDLFDVRSLDDLALLPNLKRIVGSECLIGPGMLDTLAARGIAAD